MRRGTATIAGLGSANTVLQVLDRRAGSTAIERDADVPGDSLVSCPQVRTDHAITIVAPPAAVCCPGSPK